MKYLILAVATALCFSVSAQDVVFETCHDSGENYSAEVDVNLPSGFDACLLFEDSTTATFEVVQFASPLAPLHSHQVTFNVDFRTDKPKPVHGGTPVIWRTTGQVGVCIAGTVSRGHHGTPGTTHRVLIPADNACKTTNVTW